MYIVDEKGVCKNNITIYSNGQKAESILGQGELFTKQNGLYEGYNYQIFADDWVKDLIIDIQPLNERLTIEEIIIRSKNKDIIVSEYELEEQEIIELYWK